ncbi:MAG: putative glycoside hydrolase, partial [Oscillospiraceae bacterium]
MSHVKYKKPKRSRPGRKVYKTRKSPSSKRNTANSAVKAVMCIIGLALLVFLGYSIGAPIHKYLSEKKAGENSDPSSDMQVSETTPAVTEAPPETAEDTFSVTDEVPAEAELDIPALSEIKAASVSLDVMSDTDALRDELASIKNEGFNAAVFTLKAEGGDIYFNIKSPFASFAQGDNIKSNLFADELADAARAVGLYPIARINLLEDRNIYGESGYGSYKTADGKIWTDEDGNSYLSPYNEDAIDFIDDISSEVSAGGFDYIIISGDRFPEFELSDYDELGEGLAFGDRYNALVRAANIVYDNAAEHGCGVILEVTAEELTERNAEALHPEALEFDNLAVL